MKAEDIRAMPAAERATELENLRRELLNLRCRVALGEEVNPAEMKRVRRDIARIHTIVRQEEIGAASGSAGESEA